jgi:hypothetical protein
LSKGLRKRLEQYVDFGKNEGEGENFGLGVDLMGAMVGMDNQWLQYNEKKP